jgi:NAD(P)-dependent dehydrogenase (short-subunit alcohol dehydrogenase family)
VNAVAPGAILPPPGATEDALAPLLKRVPLGRAGEPEEIAEAGVFLVRAGYITGQTLYVDGGANLWLRRIT